MTVEQTKFKRKLTGFGIFLGFMIFAVICLGTYKVFAFSVDNESVSGEMVLKPAADTQIRETDPGVIKFAFLSSAIAVALGALGAGLAVGYVGAAAMGAIGEKPELAARAILFVALAEGIAVFPLVVAIFILTKV